MGSDAWLAVAVVVATFVALGISQLPAYIILWSGLAVLLVSGVVSVEQGLAGLANEGVVTVAVLFIVAAGLRQTGALGFVVQRALGYPKTLRGALFRMVLPVSVSSAFLNNTPVVAMVMPAVFDWCKRALLPPSKLLIPLSYAAILGGLCTTIGTSTNLVVNGLLIDAGQPGLGLFEIAWLGVPCVLVGVLFIVAAAPNLLPARSSIAQVPTDPREYVVEMLAGEALDGKSVQDAGLRNLPGLYLMEVHRRERIIAAVDPTLLLEQGDRLVFVGVVDSVLDLQRIAGLQPVTQQVFKLHAHRADRCFAEVVISSTHPNVGETIRDGRFRTRYGAVVIAVSRDGARLAGRIGDIELHVGDVLLVETTSAFVERHRNSRDFYLVSQLDGEGPPTTTRAPLALAILVAMVALVGFGWLSMLQGSLVAAGLMLLSKCCSEETARRSVDWALLLAIAAAFGLGAALQETGVAQALASLILSRTANSPWIALVLIYIVTAVLTEFVTNNAAAVIVFPIALSTAQMLGVDPKPFIVTIMFAASASFITPLGYQTNMMVYGPGGYRLTDFARLGVPLSLLIGTVTCVLAPRIWPF